VQGEFADMVGARARTQRRGLERVQRGIQPGFALQARHQGQQPFGEVGGQVGAIALAPQHVPRTRERTGIVVAARAQQSAGPEFDVGRVEQDRLQRNRWHAGHRRSIGRGRAGVSRARP
jgi:hypothetical protein